MATFLDTAGLGHYLQKLINDANEKLILISPYLKISDRLKQSLTDKDRMKIDIRIIYGKDELQPAEHNWLKSMLSIRISFCQNLHAKCYLNEKAAIITSMNLYDFSQINNNEMGIHVTKENDSDLYKSIFDEVQRLLTVSEEIRVTVQKVFSNNNDKKDSKPSQNTKDKFSHKPTGYCIRTGVEIPFNIEKPLSLEAYKVWNQYGDPDFPEKYCHFSGEESHGQTSVSKPILNKNWKKAKEIHGLK